eukprot:10842809-Prorocentrum_lima.AAC.1
MAVLACCLAWILERTNVQSGSIYRVNWGSFSQCQWGLLGVARVQCGSKNIPPSGPRSSCLAW